MLYKLILENWTLNIVGLQQSAEEFMIKCYKLSYLQNFNMPQFQCHDFNATKSH